MATTPVDAEINILVHGPTLGSTTLDIDLRIIEKGKVKDLESAAMTAASPEIVDSHLVDWDGPNDQDNPE